ncbi:hypothetical protein CcrBL47_gp449 [Caulobacter phage BL47]|nr:hypothetical protein CcrBL47_gp449 [Caulobacter phage BL47]
MSITAIINKTAIRSAVTSIEIVAKRATNVDEIVDKIMTEIRVAEEAAATAADFGLPVQVMAAFADAGLPITEVEKNTTYENRWEVNVRAGKSEPLIYLARSVDGRWFINEHGSIGATALHYLIERLNAVPPDIELPSSRRARF